MGRNKGSLGPANDDVPEDEIILAKLIQNVKAVGGKSCRGAWSNGKGGYCAVGARNLFGDDVPNIDWGAVRGNDALDTEDPPPAADYSYLRNWNVGAAYEQALRHG